MTLDVRRATGDDVDRVAAILEAAELPTDDLADVPAAFFLGRADGEVVAVGGLEDCGSAGLLRSVAVPRDARGNGYGSAMVAALVERASDAHAALYLLTTDAAGFFERHGFERVNRDALPAGVRETRQFSELCPTSATAMRRPLA